MPHSPTVYHPGVSHKHMPSGRWAAVQANPNSSMHIGLLCKVRSPRELVDAAIFAEFRDKPIALKHLQYYLAGTGTDYLENANIELMLRTDKKIQALIAAALGPAGPNGLFAGSFKVEQEDYENQDLRFAFGALDILDFEADFAGGTLKAWFQDCYEWHPYYPALYPPQAGDGPRPTNAVHAALVELKSSGAADFWMKGEATVPLSLITGAGASAPSRSASL